jgi:hypothetical protein
MLSTGFGSNFVVTARAPHRRDRSMGRMRPSLPEQELLLEKGYLPGVGLSAFAAAVRCSYHR